MKLLFILFILATNLFPQQSKLSESVNKLTEFISSDYFEKLKINGDILPVDTIYYNALRINNYNYSEALLSLTFATIPYKEVPIQIPLTNVIINFPLVSHNDSLFTQKNNNLPKDIFFDSPDDDFGDKDKLAHFFGSAFIGYHSTIFDLGLLIGYFVEVFEESFKVQSSIDERDIEVNELGNLFGKILKKNKNVLPSHILIINSLKHFTYSP